jgi:hypothetical protein
MGLQPEYVGLQAARGGEGRRGAARGGEGRRGAARGGMARRISRLSRACARGAAASPSSPRASRWSLRRTRWPRGRVAPMWEHGRGVSGQNRPSGPSGRLAEPGYRAWGSLGHDLELKATPGAQLVEARPACFPHGDAPPTSRRPLGGGRPWPHVGWRRRRRPALRRRGEPG